MNLDALRRPDPYYEQPTARMPHKSHAQSAAFRAYLHTGLRTQDHRTHSQREAAQFRGFYPFLCAARAEDQHVAHVAKSQATLRWQKAKIRVMTLGELILHHVGASGPVTFHSILVYVRQQGGPHDRPEVVAALNGLLQTGEVDLYEDGESFQCGPKWRRDQARKRAERGAAK